MPRCIYPAEEQCLGSKHASKLCVLVAFAVKDRPHIPYFAAFYLNSNFSKR